MNEINSEAVSARESARESGRFGEQKGINPPERDLADEFHAREARMTDRDFDDIARQEGEFTSKGRDLIHARAVEGGPFTDDELDRLSTLQSSDADIAIVRQLATAAQYGRHIRGLHPEAVSIGFASDQTVSSSGSRKRWVEEAVIRDDRDLIITTITQSEDETNSIRSLIEQDLEWEHSLADPDGQLDIDLAVAFSPADFGAHMRDATKRQREREELNGHPILGAERMSDYDQYAPSDIKPEEPSQKKPGFFGRLFG